MCKEAVVTSAMVPSSYLPRSTETLRWKSFSIFGISAEIRVWQLGNIDQNVTAWSNVPSYHCTTEKSPVHSRTQFKPLYIHIYIYMYLNITYCVPITGLLILVSINFFVAKRVTTQSPSLQPTQTHLTFLQLCNNVVCLRFWIWMYVNYGRY